MEHLSAGQSLYNIRCWPSNVSIEARGLSLKWSSYGYSRQEKRLMERFLLSRNAKPLQDASTKCISFKKGSRDPVFKKKWFIILRGDWHPGRGSTKLMSFWCGEKKNNGWHVQLFLRPLGKGKNIYKASSIWGLHLSFQGCRWCVLGDWGS